MTSDLRVQPTKHAKTILWIVSGFIVVIALTGAGSLAWASQYNETIAPNVYVGSHDLGGLSPEEARVILQRDIDTTLTDGIPVLHNETRQVLPLATLVSSDLIEHVEFDLDTTIERARKAGHAPNPITNTFTLLRATQSPTHIEMKHRIDEESIKKDLRDLYPDTEVEPVDPAFLFQQKDGAWEATIEPGKTGLTFDTSRFFDQLQTRLAQLDQSEIELTLETQDPLLTKERANQLAKEAEAILTQHDTVTLTHTNDRDREHTWEISAQTLAPLLKPTRDGIIIDREALDTYLEPIAKTVERDARNAKFNVENGRVTEFVSSTPGVRLDKEQIALDLKEAIESEEETLVLATEKEEPQITTDKVNDLGITEILGSGISSYKGSPLNRRKNIQNGVDLLNGLIIPPGETFSLNDALKPYTVANGYLPELVIKGDEIIPEIGGGLCQIGTTTFRSVMNSGLPVIDRRNHSLVVSYYNDLTNGNPGTDATLYDPAPDFKFKNDTDHHILFQAENLVEEQTLRFTMWGTSDGRKGSYEPPTVLRWIPVGPTKYIESTKLPPGEEKCQAAHTGADTTFTYTVKEADGTVREREFESHYRPLPRICLVGVDPNADEDEVDEDNTKSPSDEKPAEEQNGVPVSDEEVTEDAPAQETVTETENGTE